MNLTDRCLILSILGTVVSFYFTSLAAVNQWPTLRGSVRRTGFVDAQLPKQIELLWACYFEGERISTGVEPIVWNGKLYIGTHAGSLYALDAISGVPLWRFQTRGPIFHSPACWKNVVIIGSTDGCLYGLDSDSGKMLWKIEIGEGGFSSSFAISDGICVSGSRSGKLIGVEAISGRLVWEERLAYPIRQTPAVYDKRVFVTDEGLRVYCIDLYSGKRYWMSNPLNGQSGRDYYPIVAKKGSRLYVIIRTNPVRNMAEQLGMDLRFLCNRIGLKNDWRTIEAWIVGQESTGTKDLWRKEQEAVVDYLEKDRLSQTFFVLDGESGKELPPLPIMWVGGCQGVGVPPVALEDGRLFVMYRSAYGNWNLGVAPFVGLGFVDIEDRQVTPLFHIHGNRPPWNTFWGTADEAQNFVIVGRTVLIVHQGTLSGYDLETGSLWRIWGERDSWGGFRNLPWARNEWHGPARGGVAIAYDRIYWQTGSRVLCIGEKKGPYIEGEQAIKAEQVPLAGKVEGFGTSSTYIQKKLTESVHEFISERWMPLCTEKGLGGREFYFESSTESFEALAWAYPHLPNELQKKVKAFLDQEWITFPPFSAKSFYPLDKGKEREYVPLPSELRSHVAGFRYPHIFGNLYVIYLYAQRVGEVEKVKAIWPQLRIIFKDFKQSSWRIDPAKGDIYANRYISSIIAFAKLAQLFNDEESQFLAMNLLEQHLPHLLNWWRNAANSLTMPVFKNVNELDFFIGKGDFLFYSLRPHNAKVALFIDMSPELAMILKKEVGAEVMKVWTVFEQLCPSWYVVGEERQVHYGENYIDGPDFALAAFKVWKWLIAEGADNVVKKVDMPFCKADLYFIIKCALALED